MFMNLNKRISIRPVRLKYKFTSEECFAFLLALIWTDSILLSYVRAILIRIPYISDYREHIVALIFLGAFIPSIPYILRRINYRVVFVYLGVFLVYLINMLIFPQNTVALEANLVPFLFESLPLVFVGMAIDLKKNYRMLYLLSMMSVLVQFVHLLLEPSNMIQGDMSSSYHLLPHVCLVIADTLSERKLWNLGVSLLGIFSIISFGSRGPVLCIFFLLIIYMLIFQRGHKNFWAFLLVVVCILCFSVFYDMIIQVLLRIIQRMGMSTRIMSMLISGDIASSTGRDRIQRRLMEAVSANWFGYGIAADRTIIGTYSHNILIELWVSYGVILGTVLFVVPVFYTIRLLIKKGRENTLEGGFILALICSYFIKLFLSGTYLTESFLYLLIGILISEGRFIKKRSREGIQFR